MRRVRLDQDDLIVFLRPGLEEQGYIAEGHKILGFEYKTKTIKKGGDYYKDGVNDKDYPPEGVEVIQWVKVLIGPPKRKSQVESEAEAPEVEDGES